MPVDGFGFYASFDDSRGSFKGIINQGHWQEINFVETHANKVRGGHFHRHTQEIIFILSGKAIVDLAPSSDLTKSERIMLASGEGIKIPPYTNHVFTYLEKTTHVQLLDRPFDPANQDIYTLPGAAEWPVKA